MEPQTPFFLWVESCNKPHTGCIIKRFFEFIFFSAFTCFDEYFMRLLTKHIQQYKRSALKYSFICRNQQFLYTLTLCLYLHTLHLLHTSHITISSPYSDTRFFPSFFTSIIRKLIILFLPLSFMSLMRTRQLVVSVFFPSVLDG